MKQEHEPLAAYYPVPIERGPENGVAARVRRRKARAKETAANKSNALKSKIKKEKDAAEAELESMLQEIDDALKAQKAAEAQIENAESIIASVPSITAL